MIKNSVDCVGFKAMNRDKHPILEPLITEEKIKVRVQKLVETLVEDFTGDELVVIGLLKGSFMFLSDLVRLLYQHEIPLLIDFLTVFSYGSGTESSGEVRLDRDISVDVQNKRVLLVDDILDSGRTLYFVSKHLLKKNPLLLKTCVFLDKPSRRVVSFHADYVGFTVPDAFVVGYGLDYDGRYRELPHVAVLSMGEKSKDADGIH